MVGGDMSAGRFHEASYPEEPDLWEQVARLRDPAVRERVLLTASLVIILLLGAYFRFLGRNWDEGTLLHPDERFMVMLTGAIHLPKSFSEYLDSANSPLNPYTHGYGGLVYGTLPIFLTRWAYEVLSKSNPVNIELVGRFVSALFDLGTIYFVYLLARKLYDLRVGVVAAFLAATTVYHIQQSHFYVVDMALGFFIVATAYFAARVADDGNWRDFLLMGLCYGLGVACKISAAFFLPFMLLACALRLYRRWKDAGEGEPRPLVSLRQVIAGLRVSVEVRPLDVAVSTRVRGLIAVGLGLMGAGLVAFLAFRLAQPYSFEGPGLFDIKPTMYWLSMMGQAQRMASGLIDWPPSHQWAGRTPLWFPFKNMVQWAMGFPLGAAAWLGWAIAGWELLRRRKFVHLVPFTWVGFWFLYQGSQFVCSIRYMVPIYPFLAMFAAYLVVRVWDAARAKAASTGEKRLRLIWMGVAASLGLFVLLGTFLYAFAFTRIYTRRLTRVQASSWMYDHIPQGSKIASETSWDDALPWRGVDGKDAYGTGMFVGVQMQLYSENDPPLLEQTLDWLDMADYIVSSSNRVYGSVIQLPMRFPFQINYYNLMFQEKLGFKIIKVFTSYPTLGPIRFVDDEAEESFTVYDHPKVIIWQKTPEYSRERARELLDVVDWDAVRKLTPIELPSYKNGLMLTAQQAKIQREGGTWSAMFHPGDLANRLPLLVWLLVVEVVGLAAFPWMNAVGRNLPDRGWALSKALGLLLLAWLSWMLVNTGLFRYTRGTILLSLFLTAAGAGALVYSRRDGYRALWQEKRRIILLEEVAFLAFFLGFLLLRWGNPDLWHAWRGGEKPMDFAYLNAVMKSSIFPPYDPWFAGGYLNYYYFGQIIMGTLVKLTGIVPWVAYNLTVPLLAALIAIGAFSVAYNLMAGWGERQAEIAGLVAGLFVAVLGNLGEAALIVRALRKLNQAEIQTSLPVLRGIYQTLGGLKEALVHHTPLPIGLQEWYWNASRVMVHGEINEFPFFTILYADLHAHFIALPFTLLAVGLALNYVLPRINGSDRSSACLDDWDVLRRWPQVSRWVEGLKAQCGWLERVDWAGVGEVFLAALTVGALRCINTWDWPTYLLVTVGALALGEYGRRGRIDAEGIQSAGLKAVAVAVLSVLLFRPFDAYYGAAYTAFERWKGPRTGFTEYFLIHGVFLFVIVSWLITEFLRRTEFGRTVRFFSRWWYRPARAWHLYSRATNAWFRPGVVAGLILLVALKGIAAREYVYTFGLLILVLTLSLGLRRNAETRRRTLVFLIGLALCITMAVEVLVLKGDIGRMNTVFKFYLQVWVLWGVTAAACLVDFWPHLEGWEPGLRNAWRVVFAVLVFCAALYPILASKAKIRDRFDPSLGPGLDGMAFMQTAVYNDAGRDLQLHWDQEAIEWMLSNVEGSPVVAEGNAEPYRWGSRVSVYTGLPTIVGYNWHQKQQRQVVGHDVVDRRLNDVREFYTTADETRLRALIRKYNVEYIYFGEMEEAYYGPEARARFGNMAERGLLELVYRNEQVQIFRVR